MFNTHLKKISRITNYNIDRSLYFRLDANERTIPFSKKNVSKLNIDDISYLRKKRDKPRSQSIKGSTNYSPVMVIRWNRAYAVNKESKQYILLFEHYDKSKFDKGFREINKLIKNIT